MECRQKTHCLIRTTSSEFLNKCLKFLTFYHYLLQHSKPFYDTFLEASYRLVASKGIPGLFEVIFTIKDSKEFLELTNSSIFLKSGIPFATGRACRKYTKIFTGNHAKSPQFRCTLTMAAQMHQSAIN